MDAPSVFISADSSEENFRDTIDIGVDVNHPEHLLKVPIQDELRALRDRVEIAETERATLRTKIKTMGVVKTVLRNHIRDERLTRIKIERQLASVQESHRQDREDFKKLKDFMTSQYRYRSQICCFMIII
ncbi:hypothetical protein Tco_0269665 [Tanacetum coccineum]